MIYVYDVVLNLNSNLIEYFEWEEKDNIKYIRKIPFYKISKTTMNDFIKNNVVVDKDFLDKIYDKCKLEENYNNDYKYLNDYANIIKYGLIMIGILIFCILGLAGSNVRWVPEIMINGQGANSNTAMDAVGLNMLLDIEKKQNK